MSYLDIVIESFNLILWDFERFDNHVLERYNVAGRNSKVVLNGHLVVVGLKSFFGEFADDLSLFG